MAASNIEKTSQEVLNDLFGSDQHSKTEQEVGNDQKNYTDHQYTLQELFCAKAGIEPTIASEQEALHGIIAPSLEASGVIPANTVATAYSTQELLNLAEGIGAGIGDLF